MIVIFNCTEQKGDRQINVKLILTGYYAFKIFESAVHMF